MCVEYIIFLCLKQKMEPIATNIVNPLSLFSEIIPRLVNPRDLPEMYRRLKNNMSIPVEWQDRYGEECLERLTCENWREYLIPKKTIVYVPISMIGIHHKYIEKEGHDKIIEMRFIKKTEAIDIMLRNNIVGQDEEGIGGETEKIYQLTFELLGGMNNLMMIIGSNYVCCKTDKIDGYEYPMMFKHTEENARRFKIRDGMLQWYYSK